MIAQLNKDYIFTRPSKVYPRLLSYFFYEGRPATTKGRWFNPITFRSIRNAAHSKQVAESESPIFITGTGRSGSTILGLVLSMHSEVGFLNEPKALWYLANPEDDLIGSYSEGNARFIMNQKQATTGIADFVKSVYSSFLRKTNSKRIVDKFPEMIFRIEYLNAIFKNPKYIFLHRNPWDTIASTAIWSVNHQVPGKEEDWWGVKNRKWNLLVEQIIPQDPHLSKIKEVVESLTSQNDKAAVEWIVSMNYGIKMLQLFPDKILSLKYEDLSSNPEHSLQQLCDFTGLQDEKDFLNFGKKILRPSANNHQVTIHPCLNAIIIELSEKLGYSASLQTATVSH